MMSARKKNSLNRRVRRAYDQNELARVCRMPEQDFGPAFGMQTVTVEQARAPEDYYHFRDNGSSVLAVAHLDTVVRGKDRRPHFSSTSSGPLVTCGALDDRLGAYVILSLLPKLGVTCDWLLTVGEESAQSTAEHFDPAGKKYDWVIEFDRAGTDVVMYQYEDGASRDLVEDSGAVVGMGSFSDIAYLEHLKVKAFNWGVGYGGNYHSKNGYAYLCDTFSMVAKYLRFHAQNSGTALPHEPVEKDNWSYGSKSWSSSKRYEDVKYLNCKYCYAYAGVDPDTLTCDFCECCAECGETAGKNCWCYSESSQRRYERYEQEGHPEAGDFNNLDPQPLFTNAADEEADRKYGGTDAVRTIVTYLD